jgi:hypothetical protein
MTHTLSGTDVFIHVVLSLLKLQAFRIQVNSMYLNLVSCGSCLNMYSNHEGYSRCVYSNSKTSLIQTKHVMHTFSSIGK